MIVLGIETSCDETAICFLKIEREKIRVLSHFISSQVKIHKKYGGIHPYLAKRMHEKNLPLIFKKAVKKGKIKKIDLVAVATRPGLEPCLWQGFNFAKKIAKEKKVSLIGLDHLEAHILVNLLEKRNLFKKIKDFLPGLCLVVSGGHTNLFLMKKIGVYLSLGKTRDDAVGECQDKIGRMLGFSYPAGPKITSLLKKKKIKIKISLPRPMIFHQSLDFSFSGLKTAVFYEIKKRKKISFQEKVALLKEMRLSIRDVLISKTLRAIKEFKPKSLFLGGGVIKDDFLRREFKKLEKKEKIKVFIPRKENCTDNALMISFTGYLRYKNNLPSLKISDKEII
ncbi:MAG: tRNA (adenosine(37)-N6)-threonylcarbamoyltransferase complex transferase subunit TsaD [Minisyncoccales bacterium]